MNKYIVIFIFLTAINSFNLISYDNYISGKVYNLDEQKSFLPFDYFKSSKKTFLSSNPVSLGILFFFNIYRNYLSKVDGPKCPYYPTCSQFGVDAVREYGIVWGLVMLFNRQMREYPNLKIDPLYPKVVKYGKLRVFDPPYRAYLWSRWWEKK